jgi:hypothetical protein
MTRKILSLISLFASLILSLHAHAAPPRVAILGDSITFDGRWATRVEATRFKTYQDGIGKLKSAVENQGGKIRLSQS